MQKHQKNNNESFVNAIKLNNNNGLSSYGGSAVGILIAISQFRSGIITPGGL